MSFLETWRWYGPNDPVSLQDIRQAGAKGIVTALHHIPNGEVWPVKEIQKRQQELAAYDLPWSVVESIPVHEDIKRRTGNYEQYLDNYQQSLRNLATCGIRTVCYNFMPVLDWTRTDLTYEVQDGSLALRFDEVAMAAFDIHILKRATAKADYESAIVEQAEDYFRGLTLDQCKELERSIIKGLPGAEEGYDLGLFAAAIKAYETISPDQLKQNLYSFLEHIIPVSEEVGIQMAIHPDDPPFPLFGLPRVVSTAYDIRELLDAVKSMSNGLTFCSGSLGARADNDLTEMVEAYGEKIHFVHLRNIQREQNRSFHEADHLTGSVDMYEVVRALVQLHKKDLPMRPDHGHQMLDDLSKSVNPGYSAIGRLRGLAELRGLTLGITKTLNDA
ncbi:MAG: mannonate dehydratase [Cytophagales bacterium]|nr:mannonate dehydratase [Cytophagales bacterium]